ncbi:hypothetical protein B0H14DRAFT_3528294 [Mycena olivaceomarginata]|nr:hypothetical protein B0H14DRAFT_3528294 [Mycena olivaceomarginata]
MQGGFPHLGALWGNVLPFHLPVDLLRPPKRAPWVGPIVDAMFEDVREQKLMREGKPLPARAYSEDTSPYTSHWWPESVKILHWEALREEDCLKNDFRHLFPLLNTKLACSFAIFFLRTRLQEGITASAAARAAALAFDKKIKADEAAALAAAYVHTLMSDQFLTAWVTIDDVHLWGTHNDPRNPGTGGWATTTGGWGARVAGELQQEDGVARVAGELLPEGGGGWGTADLACR